LQNGNPARYSITTDAFTFSKIWLPKPKLLIAGQGAIFSSLAALAAASGFSTWLLAQNDDTKALLIDQTHNDQHFKVGGLSDLATILPRVDEFTALISLFHDHDLETPLFASALEKPLFYFGALGSKKTQAARVTALSEAGVDAELIGKIHGPVGLDIGAITPEQIAVSILAQVISEMNTRDSARFRPQYELVT
ncbi:MAG: XdhC family protein, partial [Pseudomonadota bacterium]